MTDREYLTYLLARSPYLDILGGLEYWEKAADNLIANGVTFQLWIPVTERLPERGQEVIVFSGGYLKPNVFAYHFWSSEFNSWQGITHWMPMPEIPKE